MTPEDVDTQASGLSFHSKSRLNSPRALARIPESDDDNVLPSFQNQQLKRMQPYSLTLSPLTRALLILPPLFHPQLISDSRLRSLISCQVLNSVGSRTDQPRSSRSIDFLEDA
jgi:hypothetical protein